MTYKTPYQIANQHLKTINDKTNQYRSMDIICQRRDFGQDIVNKIRRDSMADHLQVRFFHPPEGNILVKIDWQWDDDTPSLPATPKWCLRDVETKKWISWSTNFKYGKTSGYYINKNNPTNPPVRVFEKSVAYARTFKIEKALGRKVEWIPILFEEGNRPEGYTGVWTTPFSKLKPSELAQVDAYDAKAPPASAGCVAC